MKIQSTFSRWVLLAMIAASHLGAAATQPASGVHKVVHRVTGIFAPDREADLREALLKVPGVELVSLDFDHSEATFAYDPAKAFAGTKPDKIIERFDQELRNASHHTMGI